MFLGFYLKLWVCWGCAVCSVLVMTTEWILTYTSFHLCYFFILTKLLRYIEHVPRGVFTAVCVMEAVSWGCVVPTVLVLIKDWRVTYARFHLIFSSH